MNRRQQLEDMLWIAFLAGNLGDGSSSEEALEIADNDFASFKELIEHRLSQEVVEDKPEWKHIHLDNNSRATIDDIGLRHGAVLEIEWYPMEFTVKGLWINDGLGTYGIVNCEGRGTRQLNKHSNVRLIKNGPVIDE